MYPQVIWLLVTFCMCSMTDLHQTMPFWFLLFM